MPKYHGRESADPRFNDSPVTGNRQRRRRAGESTGALLNRAREVAGLAQFLRFALFGVTCPGGQRHQDSHGNGPPDVAQDLPRAVDRDSGEAVDESAGKERGKDGQEEQAAGGVDRLDQPVAVILTDPIFLGGVGNELAVLGAAVDQALFPDRPGV